MGHTNSTANLSLPQFIGTDKPTWLGDVNGAFSAIDAYAGTNDTAVAAAVSDASSAVSQAAAAVNSANTANTTAGNASTAANNAIGVANTANAIAGTVDAKVGLLADLHTSDRTSIVNAINELADAASSSGIVEVWTNPDVSQPQASGTIATFTRAGVKNLIYVVMDSTTSDIAYEFISEKTGRVAVEVNPMDNATGRITKKKRLYTVTESSDSFTVSTTDASVTDFTSYGTAATGTTNNNVFILKKIYAIL